MPSAPTPFLCPSFIALSTEYFQLHMVFISANEGHTGNKEQEGSNVPLCQIPPWAEPKPRSRSCVSDSGAIGPAPAAQSVTPDHAQPLPWQPLHCAPWRPRVTTADAATSRPTPFSPPRHALTQHRRPRIPATRRQEQSVRLRPRVNVSEKLLSL